MLCCFSSAPAAVLLAPYDRSVVLSPHALTQSGGGGWAPARFGFSGGIARVSPIVRLEPAPPAASPPPAGAAGSAAAGAGDAGAPAHFAVGDRVLVTFPGEPPFEAVVWAVSGDAYTVRYCYDGELEERLDRSLLSAWRPDSGAKRLTLDELMIQDRLGEGTQSEVLSGYLPGGAPVAVKLGLKRGAISREAAVLSALSGRVGFPLLLHHEPEGSATPGGCLVMEVLGPSLEDLRRGKSGRARLSGAPFLRVGRGVLRLLRRLHAAGFVHNDLKPANVLLGSGAELQPKPLHLIDFGSCTRADGQLAGNEPTASGPRGTPLFASVAADEGRELMRPVDDVESLAYALAFLGAGGLPWQGKPDEIVLGMKRELMAGALGRSSITDALRSDADAAALEALWAEVRRCHSGEAQVDYDACLAALGGGEAGAGAGAEAEAEAEALSELSFMAALGEPEAEEGSGAGVRLVQPPAWALRSPVGIWGRP